MLAGGQQKKGYLPLARPMIVAVLLLLTVVAEKPPPPPPEAITWLELEIGIGDER